MIKQRVVFAGTPEFAVPALEALAARHSVVAVYTQPDRPAGRGRKLTAGPVKQTALNLNIPIEQPQTLRTEEAAQQLASYKPDVMVVAAYGLLLPPNVLAIPRLGCINIHASLLPRWRGAAPIHRAILAGDAGTGICIMHMEAGLDTGPVYLEKRIPIAPTDTAGSLHDKLAALGASAIIEALNLIGCETLQARAQDASAATYARKLEKSEALIDWSLPAVEIDRRVRAFNPWPIAETRWDGQQLRIWAAHVVAEEDAPSLTLPRRPEEGTKNSLPCEAGEGWGGGEPGTVLTATNDGIFVACGDGILSLDLVQLPGGRPQPVSAFLNSHSIHNARLG